MTVLVTGATGFIGSWTLPTLTAAGLDVVALLRDPRAIDQLQERTAQRGGDGSRVRGVTGDLGRPRLGLADGPADVDTVLHLGAVFAWGLPDDTARRTNVEGTLEVVRLAARSDARLVLVGGYMLRNATHLEELGVHPDDPDATDWHRVYPRVGAYEASKIEGFVRGRALARSLGVPWSAVHPATLCGHSVTGDLPATQPFAGLIDAVVSGRMTAVPGGPDHWLPLVTVDHVADLLTTVVTDPPPAGTELLALDPATPDLASLVEGVARSAGRRPPHRRVPIRFVRVVAGVPGLRRLVPASRESLGFIRTERFDLTVEEAHAWAHGLKQPHLPRAVTRTVENHGPRHQGHAAG